MTNVATMNFPTFIPQRRESFQASSLTSGAVSSRPVAMDPSFTNMLQALLSAVKLLSTDWGGLMGQPQQAVSAMGSTGASAPQNPWGEFQQSIRNAVPANVIPGFENSARQGAATDFVHTKMSGEQLYEILERIPDPEAQAAFYGQAAGSGSGMNNLQEVVLQKKFNGDEGARSRWINLHNSGGWAGKPFESEQYGPGSLGTWNFVTGEWSGGVDGQKKFKIPGWGGM